VVESGGTINLNGGELRFEDAVNGVWIKAGGTLNINSGSSRLNYNGGSTLSTEVEGTVDCKASLTSANYSNFELGTVFVASNTSTGRIRTQNAYTPQTSTNVSSANNFFGFNDSYGGTVEYYGSSSITLDTYSRNYFYDLEVNTTGNLSLYSSGCTSVSGNLYLKTGNLRLNNKQINIHGTIVYGAGRYIDATGGAGKVHLQGKITSTVSPCMNYFTSITTDLPAVGGTSIYSQGALVDIKNPELRFSNAGGSTATLSELKIFRSDIVTMKDNITVTDLLSVKVGILKTLTYTVFLNNSGTTALEFQTVGYSAQSTVGWISGNLKRRCANGWDYYFPVGRTDVSVFSSDYLKYRTIYVQLNSVSINPCYLTVNFNTVFVPGTCDGVLTNAIENGISYIGLHPEGWWSVIPDAGITSVDYNVKAYIHGFTSPVLVDDEFGLLKRPDASVLCEDWTTGGGTLNAMGTSGRIHEYSGALEIGYAQRNGLTSFSQFAIGRTNDPIPLPVELLTFNAQCVDAHVKLTWITASETNSDHFVVERSADGEEWDAVANIKGAGNSNQPISYAYTDEQGAEGTMYYRLKQVDYNGAYEYYGPVTEQCNSGNDIEVRLFPNPTDGSVWIQCGVSSQGKVRLCDLAGRVLSSYACEDLSTPLMIPMGALKSGLYIVEVEAEGLSKHFRVVRR
jgi:hypothetical protein